MKRQKPTGASIPSRLAREKIAPQRLKDLNETDDDEEDNVIKVVVDKVCPRLPIWDAAKKKGFKLFFSKEMPTK